MVIAIMRLGRNDAAFACCGVQARAESAAILLVRLSDEAFLPAIFAVSLFNHVYVLPKPYVFG